MIPEARPLSNLHLQALFFFDYYITGVYLILALVIYIYKGATFFYPPHTLAPEVVGVILTAIIQYFRLHMGSLANKTESFSASLWLIGLSIPILILLSFFIAFQTFVFWADVINNIFILFFVGLETILTLTTCFSFKKAHIIATPEANAVNK